MDNNNIKLRIDSYNELVSEIKTILDYNDNIVIETYFFDKEWLVEDGILYINQDGRKDGIYDFPGLTISSLGGLGKQLFSGEQDGISFIMAHEEDNWDEAYVYILDNKQKTTND